MKIKIGLLQLNPQIGQLQSNIQRATQILLNNKSKLNNLSVLILPELAFTGYAFADRSKIEPYLEPQAGVLKDSNPSPGGPSQIWARETALQYNCNVIVGYPEIDGDTIYNSAYITNSTGSGWHYRKSHLYETDVQWGCKASPEMFKTFGTIPIQGKEIRTQVGICMDLNPPDFDATKARDYEYASAVLRNNAELALVPTAWLHPLAPAVTKTDFTGELSMTDPNTDTVNYWVNRVAPMVFDGKKRVFALCNRSGRETDKGGEIIYAGSSSIFVLGGNEGEVSAEFYGALSEGEEGLLVEEVEI